MPRSTLLIRPAAIRALSPCSNRWQVYRAAHPGEEAHPFTAILDSNGLDDALWVLDRLPGPIALRLRLLVAAAYAERVQPLWLAAYPEDDRPAAAGDAAWAAAWAAWAARVAAGEYAAERVAQARVLREIIASEEVRHGR